MGPCLDSHLIFMFFSLNIVFREIMLTPLPVTSPLPSRKSSFGCEGIVEYLGFPRHGPSSHWEQQQTVVMLTVLHTQPRHSTVHADRWTCSTAKYLCLDMQISADCRLQTLADTASRWSACIHHMNSFSGVMQSKQRRSSSISPVSFTGWLACF